MKEIIELFPLQVVMFPHSKIPLHIFEERYKKLISESINNAKEFGIVLAGEGKIESTGTSVKVVEVTSRSENGEMDIITEGVQRFRLYSYEIGRDGLYMGNVEYLEDENLDYDQAAMNKAVSDYNTVVEMAYKGSVKTISLDEIRWQDGKRSLCFYMAEKCGLALPEKQTLLEMDTESERLEFITEYFENIIPKLKEAERISDIIRSDGYLQ